MGRKKKEKVKTNIYKIIDTETGKIHYVGRFYIKEKAKQKEIYGKTVGEVEKKITEEKNKYYNGILPSNKNNITLEKMILDTIFVYKKNKLKPSTKERYYSIYKNYIKGTPLGKKDIKKIQPKDLQIYYNTIMEEEGKENVVLNLNKLIKSTLNQAMQLELIYRNVATLVTLPKKQEKKIEIYNNAEINKLMDVLKKEDIQTRLIILLAITTGLRAGEIFALKWRNIDLSKNLIKVEKTIRNTKDIKINKNGQIIEGKYINMETAPKSDSSIREVYITGEVCTLLMQYRTEQAIINPNEYIFTNEMGNTLDAANFRKRYIKITEKAGIRYLKFHSLRHYYISTLVENNILIKRVQELVGHSTPTQTLNTYTHITKNAEEKTNKEIDNIFNGLL